MLADWNQCENDDNDVDNADSLQACSNRSLFDGRLQTDGLRPWNGHCKSNNNNIHNTKNNIHNTNNNNYNPNGNDNNSFDHRNNDNKTLQLQTSNWWD